MEHHQCTEKSQKVCVGKCGGEKLKGVDGGGGKGERGEGMCCIYYIELRARCW